MWEFKKMLRAYVCLVARHFKEPPPPGAVELRRRAARQGQAGVFRRTTAMRVRSSVWIRILDFFSPSELFIPML
jgi:hypothetical protein